MKTILIEKYFPVVLICLAVAWRRLFLNARLAPEGYQTTLSRGVFLLLSFLSFECIDKILVSPIKYCKDTEVYTIETKKE